MNKRTMKKGLAIILALVMVFAMTATAFAETNTDILVNVTIDTRTLSRSAVFMSKTDGTALGTTPVVTTTVSVPSGSNVLTVLNAAKTALGFEVISEASSYGGTFVTDIAGVGEKNFVGDKVWNTSTNKYDYQFTYTDRAGVKKDSLFSSESSADDYLLFASGALCSGWVYSVNGYYPSVAMDLYTTVYPEKRQFTEQHRDIPASSVFIHLSVMYIKVRRSETDLLVACSRQVSLKRFLADAYRTDDRDVAQLVRALCNRLINVDDGAAAQSEMQPITVFDHRCRLVCCNQFLFILHA